jgi:hypothetical protein
MIRGKAFSTSRCTREENQIERSPGIIHGSEYLPQAAELPNKTYSEGSSLTRDRPFSNLLCCEHCLFRRRLAILMR